MVLIITDAGREKAPPVAFEISLEDDNANQELKKPPRRLERLAEIPTATITTEDVEEKLRRAEERRQEVGGYKFYYFMNLFSKSLKLQWQTQRHFCIARKCY